MIVMNEPFPESCEKCPVLQRIGCKLAVFNIGRENRISAYCPFRPAEPVEVSEVAAEVKKEIEESSGGFEVAEMVCLMCLKRFIDIRPVGTLLKNLECPGCHKTGYIIETGEYMTENN